MTSCNATWREVYAGYRPRYTHVHRCDRKDFHDVDPRSRTGLQRHGCRCGAAHIGNTATVHGTLQP